MTSDVFDTTTFEQDGMKFRRELVYDTDYGPPWESEGHGVISDWTSRDKTPGELVLASDRGSKRYYDFAATVKIALADGWDSPPYKTGTPRERAARATHADFERMRDWCADKWHYMGVVVTLLDVTGKSTHESASLWGIESDSGDAYIKETADELASEIGSSVPATGKLEIVVRQEQEQAK